MRDTGAPTDCRALAVGYRLTALLQCGQKLDAKLDHFQWAWLGDGA